MHKLATIQFRSIAFSLTWQPTTETRMYPSVWYYVAVKLQHTQHRWFMFIGMKTAIMLDHVAIKCIKINSFSNFLSLTHTLSVLTAAHSVNCKLFILLYWFEHIKLTTLQWKITTVFFSCFVTLNHYALFMNSCVRHWASMHFPMSSNACTSLFLVFSVRFLTTINY